MQFARGKIKNLEYEDLYSVQDSQTDYAETEYSDYKYLKDEQRSDNDFVEPLIAQFTCTDGEKNSVLKMFMEMRNESMFCDVGFLCQGVLFKGHRVVVSAWSRWLKALLCEGSLDDEVVSLDVFSPESFGATLDYMYGLPIFVSLENVEAILKVVRRLEMQKLEQQCWRFLMSIIDSSNCDMLHDLADRYDCPPLKLAAFRVIQGNNSYVPSDGNEHSDNYLSRDTGLTGPGEASFYSISSSNVPIIPEQEDMDDDEDEIPSVLGFMKNPEAIPDDINRYLSYPGVQPSKLPRSANSREVVAAWSSRLQTIYQQCLPPDGEHYADDINTFQLRKANSRQPPSIPISHNKVTPARQRNVPSNYRPGGIDWHTEIKRFYTTLRMTDKAANVDEILENFAGREDQLLNSLTQRYKAIIPPALLDHLQHLQSKLETQTESSFQLHDH